MTLFFKFYYDLWTWISSKLSGDPHYDRLIYDILTENGIEYIIYLKFTDDVMIYLSMLDFQLVAKSYILYKFP